MRNNSKMNELIYYLQLALKYSLLGLGVLQAQAQKWYSPTKKEISTGIYLSTSGQNPFWLRSNQYGIVPLESQFVTFRGGVYKEYKPQNAVPLSLSKGKSDNDMSLRQAGTRQFQTDNDADTVTPSLSRGKDGNSSGLRQPGTRQFQTDISDNGLRQAQTDNDAVPLSLSKGKSDKDNGLRQAGTQQFQTDNNAVSLSLSKGKGDNNMSLRQAGTQQFQTDNDAVTPSLSRGKFDYGYGFSAVANVGKVNQILLPEAYLKARYGAFELYAGRRKEIVGLVDTTLTSGSYIWSGNALPMPKIQIGIPNYTSIIGKGLISIKWALNHGWFDDNGLVKNHFLHQKWLYGKIGKNHWKVNLFGGVNHQVMWGGYSEYFKLNPRLNFSQTINGYLAPYPLYSYQYVLIPFLQKFVSPNQNKVPGYDAGLAIGNHLGSVDIGSSLNLSNIYVFIYHQHPYDFARSLYTLNNIQDGNNGVQLSFKKTTAINHILFEYLNTTSQGRYRFGKYQDSNHGEIDNYFTHGQYKGWIYNDKIIGASFISINGVDGSSFTDNRIRSFSIAVQGKFLKISYSIRNSYVKHYGFYNKPHIGDFNYVFLQAKKQIAKSSFVQISFANDWSTLSELNWGLSCTFTKEF